MNKLEYLDALCDRVDLSNAEYRLLTVIVRYADYELENAYPSTGRLAACIGRSERFVRKTLADLREKGFLVVADAGGIRPNGSHRANHYAFALPPVPETTALPEPQVPPRPGTSRSALPEPQVPAREVLPEPEVPPPGTSGSADPEPQVPPTNPLPMHYQSSVRAPERRETTDEKRRNQERQLKALEELMTKEAGS